MSKRIEWFEWMCAFEWTTPSTTPRLPYAYCKRNREQDSWMAARQMDSSTDGWMVGWIDWTDWRPKCQSTFAVEARRVSMSMRCECRKCWPPVHKLKALSQHTHWHTHTHQSEQWTPPKPLSPPLKWEWEMVFLVLWPQLNIFGDTNSKCLMMRFNCTGTTEKQQERERERREGDSDSLAFGQPTKWTRSLSPCSQDKPQKCVEHFATHCSNCFLGLIKRTANDLPNWYWGGAKLEILSRC